MSEAEMNPQLVLVVGYSATGKSASLRNIKDQSDWLHLNTEAGKRLPFKNKFNSYSITDPLQVHEAFDHGIATPGIKGIILDSLTFLMDMFESQYVIHSSNTMAGWRDYGEFFRVMMQDKIVRFARPTVITAHVKDELDEKAMEMKTFIPIKGALKGNGVEAYFSTIVAAKKVPIKELEKYKSNLLEISEEEKELGYKHVFQTRPTKGTTGERIRSPMGMFNKEQTYMDNDVQLLINHLNEYYGVK